MDKNIDPARWNNRRVRKVIDDIEARTEEEIIVEDEAAFGQDTQGFLFPLPSGEGWGEGDSALRHSRPSARFEWTGERVAYNWNPSHGFGGSDR